MPVVVLIAYESKQERRGAQDVKTCLPAGKLVNIKQPKGMNELFIQTIGKRKFTDWSRHLEEPYESRGSSTVP